MKNGIEKFSKGLRHEELQEMLKISEKKNKISEPTNSEISEQLNKKTLKSIDEILKGQESRKLKTYKLDFPLLGKELNAVPKKNETYKDYKNRMKIIEEGFIDTAEGYLLKKEGFDKIKMVKNKNIINLKWFQWTLIMIKNKNIINLKWFQWTLMMIQKKQIINIQNIQMIL